MSFKSLTTIVTSAAEGAKAVAGAAPLARLFDAHLDVLALGVDRTQVGYAYLGSGGVLMQVAQERAEAEARGAEAAA
ncbi:MAG: universal stress protein, partial [Gemmobacter sp.]|nr:universal stress protein [Gemmobacter sp.]